MKYSEQVTLNHTRYQRSSHIIYYNPEISSFKLKNLLIAKRVYQMNGTTEQVSPFVAVN